MSYDSCCLLCGLQVMNVVGVQSDLIPAAVQYWQQALQVQQTGGPIRLLRYVITPECDACVIVSVYGT